LARSIAARPGRLAHPTPGGLEVRLPGYGRRTGAPVASGPCSSEESGPMLSYMS
jgi:hypothetical protein